jgi:hypothetical protein
MKFPQKWRETKMADRGWLNVFLKIITSLSIRHPEATSLSRTMNFNRANVGIFFYSFSKVLHENEFESRNVYNADETGVHNVQAPNKIIYAKRKKLVRSARSSESGTLVTLCVAVNAMGNCVPQTRAFPRKTFHNHFLRGGPVGCIEAENGSG